MMHDIKMVTDKDLVGRIWDDRPALPCTETFHYDEKYAGKSISEKLTQVREAMKGYNCRSHIVTKIDEIAWLYNLRAHDVPHFPVALVKVKKPVSLDLRSLLLCVHDLMKNLKLYLPRIIFK